MKNLLYKEFHLVIHPLFYLGLLFGALLLIPQWVFFIAPMYFFFIVIPNIFTISKAQNDTGFSAMLPVRRSDIIRARMASVIILEVLQILVTAVFAAVNLALYKEDNFLMNPNAAYIGFVFVVFAVFNLVFFPMFYKTGYKIGLPVVLANIVALLVAMGIELLIVFVPALKVLDGRQVNAAQIIGLAGGVVFFALLNMATLKISAKNFERIDL